jgi:hypothetical protein
MRRTLLLLFYALISVFLFRPGVPQPARFTSYYTGDATGSSSCTASGLCTKDFEIDAQGRYTYHGDLVMATAVASCTASREGVCGQYNSLPSGYRQYHLKDRITFVMDGKTCHGIVLDICGACYWPEEKQRYDIFVSGRAAAADLSGTVRNAQDARCSGSDPVRRRRRRMVSAGTRAAPRQTAPAPWHGAQNRLYLKVPGATMGA